MNVQVVSLLVQLTEDSVRLTAIGMFNVGSHLVPGVSQSIIGPNCNKIVV